MEGLATLSRLAVAHWLASIVRKLVDDRQNWSMATPKEDIVGIGHLSSCCNLVGTEE